MPYGKHIVLLEDLPETMREPLRPWQKNINAFMEEVGVMKQDVDALTGSTPEEKAETHAAAQIMRQVVRFAKTHKFQISFFCFMATYLARAWGVKTEAIGPVVEKFVNHVLIGG